MKKIILLATVFCISIASNAQTCIGTPMPGVVTSSPSTISIGTTFTLSDSGYSGYLTGTLGITFQWQSSSDCITWTNISGATNANWHSTGISSPTAFRCNVTCQPSSLSSATPIYGCTMGINNSISGKLTQIYPNPANDEFTVVTNINDYSTLIITNIFGQSETPETLISATTKINISRLPKGVYFITLSGSNGYIIRKLVKM